MALPNLITIKCIFIANNTANINDKNCSLSIVLTAMHRILQKIIKKWYYSALSWHLDDVMVGNINFLWFLQFFMHGC